MPWRELYVYWLDHHVDGRPPAHDDIDPSREIPHLMPNIMLLSVEHAGFRVLSAGSEMVRRAGYDNTGKLLDPVQMPERGAQTFIGLLAKVAATRAPVLYRVSRSVQSAFGAIAILLPLVDRAGSARMIVGGVFYEPGGERDAGNDWDPGAITELPFVEQLARVYPERGGKP